MEKIILLGMGGHAYSVLDSIEGMGRYHIVGFLDNEKKIGETYKEYSLIGTDSMLDELYGKGIRYAFVTVGYMGEKTVRRELYKKLKQKGFELPVIIDKSAVLAKNIKIGEGVYIGKKTVVNSAAKIGDLCILNTGSIIEHGSVIGSNSHIAVGGVLCGNVTVGEDTLIGAGATVIQEIKIGNQVIVGAGTVVTKNIDDNSKVIGGITKTRQREFCR